MGDPEVKKVNETVMRFYSLLSVFTIVLFLSSWIACGGGRHSDRSAEAESSGVAVKKTLSEESLSYARGLGGSPHQGEMLFLIIGATVESEVRAQALLGDALPLFGDMQPYFIVQKSDAFEGLDPGEWIVMEAYRAQPSTENIQFAKRAFPDAFVKRVVVRNEDPMPVYEDMTGE